MSIPLRSGAKLAASVAALALITACGGVKDASSNNDAAEDVADAKLVAPVAGMDCKEGTKPTGDPIVVGGSMSLTGGLAPTGQIHEAVAELVVDWVNDCGGMDGRPLEWKVLDDQSTPAQVTSNYTRLIGDKVDLVIGPYGGAATLAGAGPVTKAGYAYPTATNGAPDKLIGENHFPAWQIGGGASEPSKMFDAQAETLVEALKSTGNPPKTAYFVDAKFPTTLSYGAAVKKALEADGIEVVGSVEYDMSTTDFSSIATRVASEDPDLVYLGSLGGQVTNIYQAFGAIGYTPKTVYAALPSPTSIAGLGDEAEGIMVSSIYETHSSLADTDIARYFAKSYSEAAKDKDIFPLVETQGAAGFGAWQILLTAVAQVGPDNAKIIDWLNANEVETLAGKLSFDGYNNYGSDFNRVTQIQDGKRFLVWPKDIAGAEIQYKP